MRTENYFLPSLSSIATALQAYKPHRAERAKPNASVLSILTLLNKSITMNRILFALAFVFITGSLMARPRNSKRPMTAQAQLSQQVISHVTYPTVMAEGNYAGVVVVTFSIAADSRVSQLTVHTANKKLNDELTGQLLGKKIQLDGFTPDEIHTVRLRFVK